MLCVLVIHCFLAVYIFFAFSLTIFLHKKKILTSLHYFHTSTLLSHISTLLLLSHPFLPPCLRLLMANVLTPTLLPFLLLPAFPPLLWPLLPFTWTHDSRSVPIIPWISAQTKDPFSPLVLKVSPQMFIYSQTSPVRFITNGQTLLSNIFHIALIKCISFQLII